MIGDRAPVVAIPALAGCRRRQSRRQQHRLDPKAPDAPRRRRERHAHRPLSPWFGQAAHVARGGLRHRRRHRSRLHGFVACRRRCGQPVGRRRLLFAASAQHRRGQAGRTGGQHPSACHQWPAACRDARARAIGIFVLLGFRVQRTAPRMRGATLAGTPRAAPAARPGGASDLLLSSLGRPDGFNSMVAAASRPLEPFAQRPRPSNPRPLPMPLLGERCKSPPRPRRQCRYSLSPGEEETLP